MVSSGLRESHAMKKRSWYHGSVKGFIRLLQAWATARLALQVITFNTEEL